MKVLVAEDDFVSSAMLEDYMKDWGYTPIMVTHGKEALEVLKSPDAPLVAVLDWMMPYLSGVELCEAVQKLQKPISPYLILLTAKSHKAEVARALQAGAHDYLTKPFDPDELRARVNVGRRVVELQLSVVQQGGKLPTGTIANPPSKQVCSRCQKVGEAATGWIRMEGAPGSGEKQSPVLCPECYALVSPVLGLKAA